MANGSRKPDARPLFRRLAGGVAVACFILAAVFNFVPIKADVRPVVYISLFVGVIMAGIAVTGNWPWWGRGRA